MASILWQRTVVRDGWHNMGTDLCFWHDCYWLTHSRHSGHIAPDGGIVVLRSVDLERWQQVGYIKTAFDNRDAKIVATENKLYAYFADSAYAEVDGELRQTIYTCVSTSEDGFHWSLPVRVYKRNYWLWRVRFHDGIFYSAEKGGELLVSADGFNWSQKAFIPSTDPDGPFSQQPDPERAHDHRTGPFFNEADLFFRPDGELWCVSRTKRSNNHSLFYFSRPPYETWEVADLETMIQSPVICESGGEVYVAGRRSPTATWPPQHGPAGNTGVFRLEHGRVEPIAALPSDGDAAYPGMLSQKEGKLLISYYSQHAYTSGVVPGRKHVSAYLEEWPAEQSPRRSVLVCGPDDIYVALVDPNALDAPIRL